MFKPAPPNVIFPLSLAFRHFEVMHHIKAGRYVRLVSLMVGGMRVLGGGVDHIQLPVDQFHQLLEDGDLVFLWVPDPRRVPQPKCKMFVPLTNEDGMTMGQAGLVRKKLPVRTKLYVPLLAREAPRQVQL